ncbi:lef-11 [Cryptophlebia peltastica nucleopolyhedrovirus]|uniref:Late expression factor 11 n=1 Tax=Cryptophlebia peltastica nucleopolyhedrovirus TaxID=2304025 RepID=A0A346RNP6_9ABAC|nr:lef-11 [Cryptophlebia peltastica nucleopolyhedrovirus]AXS67693.1 lef-11 [Cryptophlebia peltastica nucleopolyhedrovirus]
MSTKTQKDFGFSKNGIEKFDESCVTRSEIYALVREVINKRKHSGDYTGVCAHIFEEAFETQMKYIRDNLKSAFVIADCSQNRKRLVSHHKRIENVFNLNTDLFTEYKRSSSRYNGASNTRRNHQQE